MSRRCGSKNAVGSVTEVRMEAFWPFCDLQLVFVDGYGQIKLLSATDGTEIWSRNIDYPILSPPLIYRGYIYFISADNRVFSVDI